MSDPKRIVIMRQPLVFKKGEKPGNIVLCQLVRSSGTFEFVTWWEDDEGNTFNGHYYYGDAVGLRKACGDFLDRVQTSGGRRVDASTGDEIGPRA